MPVTFCRDLSAQFAPCDDRDFLALFASRLSGGITADLERDGALDLSMSESLDAAALVSPLGSKRFPVDNLRQRNWVLGEIVSGYAAKEMPSKADERDKQLFVLACYLNANSADAGLSDLPTELVTAMIAERAATLSIDNRLVVARFLFGIALRYEPFATRRSEDPRPLILAAIACLVAGTFADLADCSGELAGNRGLLAGAISKSGADRWQRMSRRLLSAEGRVSEAALNLAAILEEQPDWR
jgi:hypothetical protein